MRYILILQWPGSSESDYDALISMEEAVSTSIGPYASVDGHDFGSGEMNIFIETDRPTEAFADVAQTLSDRERWSEVRAAYREAAPSDREGYTILWPEDLGEFSVG